MSKTAANCQQAYFENNKVKYMLCCVSPDELKAMRTDPETGMQRQVIGYPAYFTHEGDVWPAPCEGIDIVYV